MMKIVATLFTALVATTAVSAATTGKTNSIHLRVVQCYGGLKNSNEGEPYAWASLDESWLPGTSKAVQTGIGSKANGTWTFPCSVLTWTKVRNWDDQEIYFGVFGQDTGRPDDDMGADDFDLDDVRGLKADCVPVPKTIEIEDNWFDDDGKCDIEVAVCNTDETPVEFEPYLEDECKNNKI